MLLSPETDALSTLEIVAEFAKTLCVRDSRFSFSASDLRGLLGVSCEKNSVKDVKLSVSSSFTSSVSSKTGVLGVVAMLDVGGAEVLSVMPARMSFCSNSTGVWAMGLSMLAIEDTAAV